ncbi:unnamed protein product [Candidula unifasciata]|uniref:Solute carrier family 23 member 2 n=1 Tax=Candidula unifasciata TaxID=100452 RepID=A0A8S3ZU38_9EUPU|nr:unnamed protein product [Candidula unifasciata]
MLLHKVVVKMAEPNWIVATLTCAVNMTLSLCLASRKTPVPQWSRGRGFYILWYPLHQSFSVLLSIIFGWTLSAILTATGAITDDPTDPKYMARTDARSNIIEQTDWFTVPYPGKFGTFSISTAVVISCLGQTFVSVLDSIGDYSTCAKACRVPPPPMSAYNRGIAVEGLMNILSGLIGSCHHTVSSGSSIGILRITRVASRRVLQCCGIIYILLAFFGKAAAVFITLPNPVLAGITFLVSGLFVGFVMSLLQMIDLNSTRNLAIIGTSIMLGLMLPHWANTRPGVLDTGIPELNSFLLAVVTNPAVVGGVYACVMDNVIPGSLTERGLLHQIKDLDDEDAKRLAKSYDDGPEVYRLPFIPSSFYRFRLVKYFPIFDYTGK